MKKFPLPPALRSAARLAGERATHTSRWAARLSLRTLDAVQDVLRAEVEKGHVRQVTDFLADRALPAAKALLLERMTARLLLRLGLRGTLLTNVAGWVLPFVLERLLHVARASGLLARLEANPTVAEALARLDELRQRVAHFLSADANTGAELVAEAPAATTPTAVE